MSVRAKFKVESITHNEHGAHVKLKPVFNGSKENESFYRYTPGGQIELSTVNAVAAEEFVPGEEFYVDFTRAPVTNG